MGFSSEPHSTHDGYIRQMILKTAASIPLMSDFRVRTFFLLPRAFVALGLLLEFSDAADGFIADRFMVLRCRSGVRRVNPERLKGWFIHNLLRGLKVVSHNVVAGVVRLVRCVDFIREGSGRRGNFYS